MQRALDKATHDYHSRKGKLEMPGHITAGIGLAVLISGALLRIKTLIALSVLLLAFGAYLVILGRTTHKTILRK